ncbi:hypothetical protein DPMN_054463 [Dreissena polymorpha]|uniref:Uncharacterized protein n=1 Tax=Dreissena polymorpha TaxID=45954 RepID=A0A9D4CPI5_DREPO|nr:hypothetical protein DPMN_054463 [Dreissena polymorpha]
MSLNGLELCENGVIVVATCYELSSNFVDGIERERCFRTLSLLKFSSDHPVLRLNVVTTYWKRNGRTKNG